MAVANTLAYDAYDNTPTIAAVKSFIEVAPVF